MPTPGGVRVSTLPSDCDRALAECGAPSQAEAPAHPKLVLCTSILASSLAFIDGSVVNVGLSAIGHDLAGRGADLSWVVNGYLLLSSLLLLGGALGDHYGRKRVLIAGIAVFALASLLCALAPRLSLLVAGRMLQGLGAALLLPNSLAVLSASFEGNKRGRAVGIWAASGAAAGAIGPLLGGWLIDTVGWRAVFTINLPIAALAIFMGWRFVQVKKTGKQVPLDPAGAVLASLGLACLTWGFAEASAEKHLSSSAGLALAAGVLILLAFLWIERRAGERAMLPLKLFGSRGFSGLNLMTFLLYGALGALMLLVPFVLIQALDYSAKQAGAALLPFPIVLAIGSPLMGRVAASHGSRLPLSIGALIVAGGFLLAMRIGAGSYMTCGGAAHHGSPVVGGRKSYRDRIGLQQRGGTRRWPAGDGHAGRGAHRAGPRPAGTLSCGAGGVRCQCHRRSDMRVHLGTSQQYAVEISRRRPCGVPRQDCHTSGGKFGIAALSLTSRDAAREDGRRTHPYGYEGCCTPKLPRWRRLERQTDYCRGSRIHRSQPGFATMCCTCLYKTGRSAWIVFHTIS
jgi:EmrB/QacA subfamily drug resistance transporter